MRVLVLGASGFIGSALARRLAGEGHVLRCVARAPGPAEQALAPAEWQAGDLAAMTPADWAARLEGVDAVVNAAGALQDGARDRLEAIHHRMLEGLIAACRGRGVRIVQISAAGAAPDAATAFFWTKAAGDAALAASGLEHVILRPGLVIGAEAYGGTALLRALAAMPLVQVTVYGGSPVQTVGLDALGDAVAAAVAGRLPSGLAADLVEAEPRPLAEMVAALRAWLGQGAARRGVDLPGWSAAPVAALADLAGWLGWRAPLRSTALRVLARGVTGDPGPWRRAAGWTPPPLEATLAALPATRQERWFARAYLLLPLLILAMAGVWIASGAIGLWRREAAAALLTGAGMAGTPAMAAVIAGALADIALGLGLLVRRTARAACLGMAGLGLGYLAAGTLVLPRLWADPLGPMVKVIPMIALALVIRALLVER